MTVALAIAGMACSAGEASVRVGDDNYDDKRWGDPDAKEGTDDPGKAKSTGRKVEGHSNGTVPTATLPGFRMFDDGTSRVFMEVSAEVNVSESTTETLLTYRFANVLVPERVNRLPLPTGHFESPVSLVHVIQVGNDAELRIHLRQTTEPKTRLKRTGGGTVLSVDFPKLRGGHAGHTHKKYPQFQEDIGGPPTKPAPKPVPEKPQP